MDIRFPIAPSNPPAFRKIENQKVTSPEEDVPGCNDLFFSFRGQGE
jgi:hypothetical protein